MSILTATGLHVNTRCWPVDEKKDQYRDLSSADADATEEGP